MPNEVLVKDGTAKTWIASGGDYVITLTSLASGSTSARQGAKGDLGITRAASWMLRLQTQFALAPTAAKSIIVCWAGSPHSTAGTSNPGNASGADAAYTGYTTDAVQASRHLQFVGIMSVSATTVVQTRDVGPITPFHRYGMPVLFMNDCDQALSSLSANHIVTVFPLVDEVQ